MAFIETKSVPNQTSKLSAFLSSLPASLKCLQIVWTTCTCQILWNGKGQLQPAFSQIMLCVWHIKRDVLAWAQPPKVEHSPCINNALQIGHARCATWPKWLHGQQSWNQSLFTCVVVTSLYATVACLVCSAHLGAEWESGKGIFFPLPCVEPSPCLREALLPPSPTLCATCCKHTVSSLLRGWGFALIQGPVLFKLRSGLNSNLIQSS